MKYRFCILLTIILFSCNFNKNSGEKKLVKFDAFPLAVPEENSLLAQWEKKPVFDSLVIDDMEHNAGWEVTGIGKISYTQDRSIDGKRSLRFSTSLRDTAFYKQPKNRSEWGSFIGFRGGASCVQINFDKPQDWSAFNRISFWVYVHPTSIPIHTLYLGIENKGTVYKATTPQKSQFVRGGEHFIHDLKPGMWNHVLFEIPHLERDKIVYFSICRELIGHDPEDEDIVTYDIDRLELQRVKTDQYEGWNVAPEKFAFSHVGYRPLDQKICLVGDGGGNDFHLIDQAGNTVFTGNVRILENKNGIFHQLDFSDFQTEGSYRIRCGKLESNPFPINEDIWIQPIFKAVNFYFCERCGYAVPGIHHECHKDWQGFKGETKKVINGGWHDAGDLSQSYSRTALSAYALMRSLEVLEKRKDISELSERIRSEVVWGVEWLLKARFDDGFHVGFSMMRIYTDNKIGTIDDVVSPAQNVPWENFLAATVLSKAAEILKKSNPELANQAYVAAVEDWQFAMASRDKWDQASYLEASWGVTSSILLGRMTGDLKYKEQAIQFGNLLILCQEQNFLNGIPITGYFYRSTDRKLVIHDFLITFEEAPLIAFDMLCREYPEHENWIDWYSAAVLHSEFFMKRGSKIASPYDLLPNSVWRKSEIMAIQNEQLRKDMLRQFNDGTPLNEEYTLRTFPIWTDGHAHGNTGVQMSDAWALAEASTLRNDTKGMQLVGKQLQWVLGANPFGQSLMYGEGYDFAPQYAARLKNMVGSVPNGIDCESGDEPYWPASNYATFKEIFVEPEYHFLGAVSVYSSFNQTISAGQKPKKGIQIQTETIQSDKGVVDLTITITGTGRHELEVKVFNSKADFNKKQIDLSGNKTEKIKLELYVTDRSKPYVAVISVDKDPDLRREIFGSFYNGSFSDTE